MPLLTLLPDYGKLEVDSGESLLDLCRKAGVPLPVSCGGKGTCGKCRVRITEGCPPPEAAHVEALGETAVESGWRLSCRIQVECNMTVDVSHAEPLKERILTDFTANEVKLDSGVSAFDLSLPVPDMDNPRPDLERVANALNITEPLHCPTALLRMLPQHLRQNNWQTRAVMFENTLAGLLPHGIPPLGVAVDIGTTTLAAAMFDLSTGKTISIASRANPQSKYGDDVVSRIEYSGSKSGALAEMRSLVISACNEMIDEMTKSQDMDTSPICLCVFVGNTAMTHLLLELAPSALAVSPFVPVTLDGQAVPARELGLSASPGAVALTMPCLGPYLGSDVTAGILALGMYKGNESSLLIDVGTNGEIALLHESELYACSTAAGPAFEGARITQGMRAADGAIRSVQVADNDLQVEIVGNAKAKGICGTGLLDAVACLLDLGLIDETGYIVDADDIPDDNEKLRARITELDGAAAIHLAGEVYLRQKDIRELQLAKGAIAAGVEVLLGKAGLSPKDLKNVYLAGAFGSYLRPQSALRIGLIPQDIPARLVSAAGNTALAGARITLLNRKERDTANTIANKIKCLELSGLPEFQMAFAECMEFPTPE